MASADPTRRDFLKVSAAAIAAGSLPRVAAATPAHVAGSDVLKVGLVGCGGRGTGAASQALMADPNVKLVALGDAFSDMLESSLKTLQGTAEIAAKIDVPAARRFVGFDAYQGVIAESDVVLLATSTHFRPLHMRAAVEAGKHLFVEKPVGVDGPGIRSIRESGKLAKEKGLNVVSGLCYRYQFAKQETMKRVHAGDIGDIKALQCTYNGNGLWHRGTNPSWTPMEYQMRNWLYFTWLSADHIAEQHIHSLDKLAWAMKDEYPVRCVSSGGRVQRTDVAKYGNVYDHFNTVYEWKSGIRGFSSCRQWNDAATDVSDHAFGTKGVAHLQTHEITGEKAWKWRSDEPDDMYQNEHDALFRAIRAGKPIDNTEYMCNSTLMALMGRMAAYSGQEITWEQALNSKEELKPKAYAWGEAPEPIIAVPGLTKFS